jgi:hypothetical protein
MQSTFSLTVPFYKIRFNIILHLPRGFQVSPLNQNLNHDVIYT